MESLKAVKSHPFYQQGYIDGYKEGFAEAFRSYEKNLIAAKATTRIEVICKEFSECPFKKETK